MFGELFWNHNLRFRWTGSNQVKDFMGCCRRWSDFPSSPRLTQGNSPIHLHRHCMSPQYIRSTWDWGQARFYADCTVTPCDCNFFGRSYFISTISHSQVYESVSDAAMTFLTSPLANQPRTLTPKQIKIQTVSNNSWSLLSGSQIKFQPLAHLASNGAARCIAGPAAAGVEHMV